MCVTKYVRRYLMKVKPAPSITDSLPGRQRIFARHRDFRSPFVLVWQEHSIEVTRYANCLPELPGQVFDRIVRTFGRFRKPQLPQFMVPGSDRLVEEYS